VEVRDLVGNVGVNTQAIRGLPPPNSGCACAVPGASSGEVPLLGLLGAAAVAMVLVRRRRS
jgi:MYXO-CTERM domain-containing protein